MELQSCFSNDGISYLIKDSLSFAFVHNEAACAINVHISQQFTYVQRPHISNLGKLIRSPLKLCKKMLTGKMLDLVRHFIIQNRVCGILLKIIIRVCNV